MENGKRNQMQNLYRTTDLNRKEYEENMPKQGQKTPNEIDQELLKEDKARKKGKTLLTTGLTS